ncbi:MAG: T9SS type A sorting domain-containing protein [Bacteroidia bacterium]|nr:T9SS type A sorting domain-containing protein [Bacteroidia bacterium]
MNPKLPYACLILVVFLALSGRSQNNTVDAASNFTVITDTLNYFYNKQFFKIPNPTGIGFPFYRSAAATNTQVSHMGSVFLNSDPNLVVSGLEARLAYRYGSNAQAIPVNIYLCNVDQNLMPVLPAIDSVSVFLGAAQIDTMSPTGFALSGSFGTTLNPVSYNLPGNFAVLVRNYSTLSGDTVCVYNTSSLTHTNQAISNLNNMGEDLGRIRYNGQFLKTRNFVYPGFGFGTDYEFCVAPIVTFTLQASHLAPSQVNSQPVDTIECFEPLTFTNTSSPEFTSRFFNLNEFYRHFWPYVNTPPGGFSSDSAISWYFNDEDANPLLRPNLVLKKDSVRATKQYDTSGCFTSCSLRARYRKMTSGGSSMNIRGNVEFSVCVKGCYVGLEEWKKAENLVFFPNPVQHGKLSLKGLSRECDYSIINTHGIELLSGKLETMAAEIDISQLEDGFYLLSLVQASGPVYQKFIVKRE